jgi:deoxyribonuclease-1-like protein
MPKPVLVVVALVILVGGGWFFLNYEVQRGNPSGWKIVPRKASETPETPQAPLRPNLRIASFDLGRFDEAKLADPRVAGVLLRLLPQFDLVALQGVRGRNQGVLVRLVDQLNAATGRQYAFATCPTQQRDAIEHYCAFLYDCGRLDVDRRTVRFIDDPQGRLRIKPLMGMFRAKGPEPSEAFTFVLVNAEVDPDRVSDELDRLADAYRAVRDSQPTEDDIILVGDLESDDQHLGRLGKLLNVAPLISGIATTVRGTQLLDNILIDRRAATEFTGRVEVVDMMREFQLTQADADAISEHLPIWAEFSIYEGGQAGHVP